MIELQKKLTRVRRLSEIDERQMSVYAIDLANAEAQVQRELERIVATQDQLDSMPNQISGTSVEARTQSIVFIAHLSHQLSIADEALQKAQVIRDECLAQVVQQKKKIQGWESLITKLRLELASEQQNAEASIADDRHLSKLAGRNS